MKKIGTLNRLRRKKKTYDIPFHVKQGFDNYENTIKVTLSINVKYRKPVPYNETIIGKGLVQKETSKFVIIETEIFDKKRKSIS